MLPKIIDFLAENTRNNKDVPNLTIFHIEQLLIKYGRLVVEECTNNFELDMEWDGSMHPDMEVRERPVLVRKTVLDVINQIK